MTNDQITSGIFTTFALLVVAVLLVALGYGVNSILSPFVLTGAIVFVLYPFRENAMAWRIMALTVGLFALWFLYSILGILAPVFVAFLLAYICDPIVSRLEKHRISRWVGSLLATLAGIGVVVTIVLFVVPLAVGQFDVLMSGVDRLARNVGEVLRSGKIFDVLERVGIPVEQARNLISNELPPKLQEMLSGLFKGLFGFVTGFSSIILQIISAIIIPFIFFYLLMDFRDIKRSLIDILPLRLRKKAEKTIVSFDEILGQYLRGAIVVALIQGTISAIVLALIGVDYALVLGIMTAVLNFVPYVGLIISLIVSCIVALFSGEPVLAKVVGVVVLYLSQKILEATVLGPKIIGAKVGLHPVLLILSLTVFGYFLGFIGLLIAVPTTALLVSFLKEWQRSTNYEEQPLAGA